MLRDIFTNKFILGSITLLIIIAGGCYFWYQYTTAQYEKQAAETAEFARQWEINRKANRNKAEQVAEKVSVDSATPTPYKPKADATALTDTSIDETKKPVTAAMQETDKTEEVRVSPHGFGPYPEIPKGAPIPPFHDDETKDSELLQRVAIKAWGAGERFEGGSTDSLYGKIYLHYPNTIYVEYGEPVEDEDGNVTIPITDTKGTGDVRLSLEQMKNGEIPDGVRVLSLRDDGIDQYEYLDLQ